MTEVHQNMERRMELFQGSARLAELLVKISQFACALHIDKGLVPNPNTSELGTSS